MAADRLREAGHVLQQIGFGSVPALEPQLVDDPPQPVERFRDQLRTCDALLISAPEYAAGLAGSTKNALDWLVGDSTVCRKIIGVASAGTTGGPNAIEQLVRTISWQGGRVMATLGVAVCQNGQVALRPASSVCMMLKVASLKLASVERPRSPAGVDRGR